VVFKVTRLTCTSARLKLLLFPLDELFPGLRCDVKMLSFLRANSHVQLLAQSTQLHALGTTKMDKNGIISKNR